MITYTKFWEDVLPQTDDIYVLRIGRRTRQHAVSFDELIPTIESFKQYNDDIYVSIGSFKPDTSRQSVNNTGKKSFYIDLDCGEGKPYATKRDALTKLVEWLKRTKFLTPSYIIDSGRGIHAYWALDKAVSTPPWQAAAEAFKTYLYLSEIEADEAVTADVSRIMRAPGTLNHKTTPPTECRIIKASGKLYSLAEFHKAIPMDTDVAVDLGNVKPLSSEVFAGLPHNTKMLDGIEYKPKYFEEIVKHCPTLAHELETGGVGSDYPQWLNMLMIAVHCEDGQDYAHKASDKHATYTYDKVEQKWYELAVENARGTLHGAITCNKFSETSQKCLTCPHFHNQNKTWVSPLALGSRPDDPLELPYGWRKEDGNIVTTLKSKKDDVPDEVFVVLENTQVAHIETVVDMMDRRHLDMVLVTNKIPRALSIPLDEVLVAGPANALNARLASNGIINYSTQAKEVRRLLEAWHSKIKRVTESRGSSIGAVPRKIEQFGWTTNYGMPGFALRGTLYNEDGTTRSIAPPDMLVSNNFEPHGDEAAWRKMADEALKAGHIETEVIMAASFAAPLVKFTGQRGLMLSAVSTKSGTGKTLALKLAQSVWADPVRMMYQLNDTPNSITKRTSVASCTPACWDEVRINTDRRGSAMDAANLLFQVTQGRDKARLNQDSSAKTINDWTTMMITASNKTLTSVLDMVDTGTAAGTLRVLEMHVEPIDKSKAAPSAAFREIDNHYGHIGPQYVQWLAVNHKEVNATVGKLMEQFQKKLGDDPRHRFFLASVVTILLGAQYAKQLGYVNFNVRAIRDYLLSLFKDRAITVEQTSNMDTHEGLVCAVLKEFMEDQSDHGITTSLHKPTGGVPVEVLSLPRPGADVYFRRILDPQVIIIAKLPFDRWLHRSRYDANDVSRKLRNLVGFAKRQSPYIESGLDKATKASVGKPNTYVVKPQKGLDILFPEED